MILSPQQCGCPLLETGPSIVNSSACSGMALFMILLEGYIRGRCDIQSPCETVHSEEQLLPEYDFIVVGAGAAGAVAAGRLSEDGRHDVLVLEAGGLEPIGARVPSFYGVYQDNKEVDWAYRTEPADYCLDQKGKGCKWHRGKCVGGSNVLNGMMYHRGHRADYENWVAAGAKGWSWEENLPYFDLNEGNKQIGSLVSEEHHSANGIMPVQQLPYQPPFTFELIEAMNEAGIPVIQDMNDPNTPDGFTIAQTMSENGQRVTSARAYLKPRPNLSLKTHVQVSRVVFKGKRAVGVQYLDQSGKRKTVRARKEVILSAGALNTPQILLLSGIGPKAQLKKLKIPVVADLPVGKNLRNHVGLSLNLLVTELNNTNVLDWNVLQQYMLDRTGPMASTGLTQVMKNKYGVKLDPQYTSECNASEEWSAPWVECMTRLYTDAQNHQLGTTAIGAVVDSQLRVYHVKGLRVIDASVMPTQVTGNPQGAIMMVAERGAAFVKEAWAYTK